METEERVGDVAARRSIHHKPAAARHEKGEERRTTPLPRRYPHLTGPKHHGDQAKVGGVKDVLATPAQDELADNRDDSRQYGQGEGIGTQQQTQGETRDEGTVWLVGR